MTEQPTMLAERYVLEERIASGGMASVWRARDDVLARAVAVKLLHPHLALDDSFVQRFRVEALAAARLTHPNIVAIYDTGSQKAEDPKHFIVMEHCGGGTLGQLLTTEGSLEPGRVASIGSTICEALGYAHDHEVVHRDIKPANVLLSDLGSLKVTDFGIAKAAFAAGDLTTTGTIIGTVTYISPEQARGDEPDARSDLYALGIVLYELLVGRPPFRAETDVAIALKHIQEAPDPPRSLRAGIPRQLEDVVLRALQKDPDDRFQSAQEMGAALRSSSSGARTTAIVAPHARAEPRREKPAEAERPEKGPGFLRSEGRKILPIIFLIVAAIAAAIVIASLIDSDTPNGDASNGGGGGNGTKIDVTSATDFDPGGDDNAEHPDEVPLAHDGDAATFWTTQDYNDPIGLLKDGVGVVFDLGEPTEVSEVEVTFDGPDYEFELRAADDIGSDQSAFEEVESISSSEAVQQVAAGGTTAQFWLIWITDLPGGGGGSGSIAEVRFFGD